MKILGNKWFLFVTFILIWCALRIFWLDSDAGIPSVWEYGYHVTDEGYYMGAGKDKYLLGIFNDQPCNESFTYGYSAFTHWLSYLGYRVFGLTNWSFRVAFYLLYFLAWCTGFWYVVKRKGAVLAFWWCMAFSCVPLIVVYERTAGNDLTIACLTVFAFALASGRGVWRLFAAALITGLIVLVKPSVWILLPIVMAAVLSDRKTRWPWLDAVVFAVLTFASVWLMRLFAALSIWDEAAKLGISGFELIRRTTTHNAFPSLLDWSTLAKGFSSYPRDPAMPLLSVMALFITVIPCMVALRDIASKRWNWCIVLNLSLGMYVAAISTLNTFYTHYFHPLIMLMPLVWCNLCTDVEEADSQEEAFSWRTCLLPFVLVAGGSVILLFGALSGTVDPRFLQNFYSKIYNLPAQNVWLFTGLWVVCAGFVAVAVVLVCRGVKSLRQQGWVWWLSGALIASVAFAGLPAALMAPWLKQPAGHYLSHVVMILFVGMIFLTLLFAVPASAFRRQGVRYFPLIAVVATFCFASSWRSALFEMIEAPRHVQREVGKQIAALIPKDAVLVGERSRQVMMGQVHRTATTMPNCDPIPIVRQLFKDKCQVYGLLDSQNAYNLQHFQKHKDEFRLDFIRKFSMPSFGTGAPADVFLCQIVQLKK